MSSNVAAVVFHSVPDPMRALDISHLIASLLMSNEVDWLIVYNKHIQTVQTCANSRYWEQLYYIADWNILMVSEKCIKIKSMHFLDSEKIVLFDDVVKIHRSNNYFPDKIS